jgi:hypothetical protein
VVAVVGSSSATTTPALHAEWEGCNPQTVLNLLHGKESPVGKRNKLKLFPKTYVTWDKLSKDQVRKVSEFYVGLDYPDRINLIKEAKNVVSQSAEQESTKQEPPTVTNDVVRILELRQLPEAQGAWTALGSILNRRQLDARKSKAVDANGVEMQCDSSPYSTLTAMYNDWDGVVFQNRLVEYELDPVTNVAVKCFPIKAVESDREACAMQCSDVDPHDLTRRSIVRSTAWFKKTWLAIRSILGNVLVDFNRSGSNQNIDWADVDWYSPAQLKRWVFHSNNMNRRWPQASTYGYCTLDHIMLQSMGREATPGTGRDSSIKGDSKGSAAEARSAAERKRKRRKEELKKSSRGKNEEMEPLNSDKMAKTMERQGNISLQIEMLKTYMQFGSATAKEAAMNEMSVLYDKVKSGNIGVTTEQNVASTCNEDIVNDDSDSTEDDEDDEDEDGMFTLGGDSYSKEDEGDLLWSRMENDDSVIVPSPVKPVVTMAATTLNSTSDSDEEDDDE